MKLLTNFLQNTGEVNTLFQSLEEGISPVALSGLSSLHRAHVVAYLYEKRKVQTVVFVSDEEEGGRLQKDLSGFLGIDIPILTSRPFLFYGMDGSHQWEQKRISLLSSFHKKEIPVLIATIEGGMQRSIPPDILEKASISVKVGDVFPLTDLVSRLVSSGYTRGEQVEGVGQFSIRGGIVDIFSTNSINPVRLDFFGDDLDSLGYFEVSSQRRTENLQEFTIYPVKEVLEEFAPKGKDGLRSVLEKKKQGKISEEQKNTLEKDIAYLESGEELSSTDRYLSLIYPKLTTILDYMPKETQVFFSECGKLADRAKSWQWQIEEDMKTLLERGEILGDCCECSLTFPSFNSKLKEFPVTYLDSFTLSTYPSPPSKLLSMVVKQLPAFGTNITGGMEEMGEFQKQGCCVLVLVTSTQRGATLHQQLEEQGILSTLDYQLEKMPEEGQIVIALGGISGGMEYPNEKLVVFSEGNGAPLKKVSKKKSATNRQHLKSYGELSVGDLVVHEYHGIGRYMGMEKMKVDGIDKDYILIAYDGTDQLYVPATQLDLVSKYIGGGEDGISTKKLSKLGGDFLGKIQETGEKSSGGLGEGSH